MSNAVATTENPKTFVDLLDQPKWREKLSAGLPAGVTVDRIKKIVMSAMTKPRSQLMACTPVSMYQAVTECASLDLWPNALGHAYLVPYMSNGQLQAQFQIGYRGMIELAYRSGKIVPGSFVASAVYEHDFFDHEKGSTPFLKHKPTLGERGKIVAYYAGCKPVGGDFIFEVMSPEDVHAIHQRSKAKDSGPWQTDYVAMACKTVIRKLWKLLPASVTESTQEAMERDKDREFDLAKEVAGSVIPDPKPAKMRGGDEAHESPSYDDEPAIQIEHGEIASEQTIAEVTHENIHTRVEDIIKLSGEAKAKEIVGLLKAKYGIKRIDSLGAAQCKPFLHDLNVAFEDSRQAVAK